jgi:hypothetical protein
MSSQAKALPRPIKFLAGYGANETNNYHAWFIALLTCFLSLNSAQPGGLAWLITTPEERLRWRNAEDFPHEKNRAGVVTKWLEEPAPTRPPPLTDEEQIDVDATKLHDSKLTRYTKHREDKDSAHALTIESLPEDVQTLIAGSDIYVSLLPVTTIVERMRATFGAVSKSDVDALLAITLTILYDPSAIITHMSNMVNAYGKLQLAGQIFPEYSKVLALITSIKPCSCFDLTVTLYENEFASLEARKLTTLVTRLTTAHANQKHIPSTAKQGGFAASATTTQPDALAALQQEVQRLSQTLTAFAAGQVNRTPNLATATNTKRPKLEKDLSKLPQLPQGVSYCYTCGENRTHSSCDCTRKNAQHLAHIERFRTDPGRRTSGGSTNKI